MVANVNQLIWISSSSQRGDNVVKQTYLLNNLISYSESVSDHSYTVLLNNK